MPAAAFRQPETEVETSPVPASTDNQTDLEWRTVAPYVERFTSARPATAGAVRRKSRKRHRPFVLSGPFLAGTLIFCELMGLVWIYALDLSALRQEDALKKQIQQTSLQIALNQNKLASYKSSPLLSQWATQLGYRPIEANDFDDVTSNAPVPAPTKVPVGGIALSPVAPTRNAPTQIAPVPAVANR